MCQILYFLLKIYYNLPVLYEIKARLAQLVERPLDVGKAGGSNPSPRTAPDNFVRVRI